MQFRTPATIRSSSRVVNALDGVSFELWDQEVVGLVGESGSGKSTIAQILLHLVRPSSGEVLFRGIHLDRLGRAQRQQYRRTVQAVFQDPRGSLSPRRTVRQSLNEAMIVKSSAEAREREISRVMSVVGLGDRLAERLPRALSGGQAQRVAIARALIPRPSFLICDEPLSSLDMSIQAQILNLFSTLRRAMSLGLLFISHDLTVVRYLADRVIVLYLGRVVETGRADEVLIEPKNPYTAALISAEPMIRKPSARRPLALKPSIRETPGARGCALQPRCWLTAEIGYPAICAEHEPKLEPLSATRASACHFAHSTSLDRTIGAQP